MTPNADHLHDQSSTDPKDAAAQEAQQLKGRAGNAVKDVAGTARAEAGNVKDEAVGQAKSLVSSFKDEANNQASTQQQRLAQQSRSVSDDLRRLAQGEKPESDVVNRVVSDVADRAERFTAQLENKEPADLFQDVRRFAARRPGTFLAIAAGVGLLAGRLTRGLKDAADDDNDATTGSAGRATVAGPRPPVPGYQPVVPTIGDRVPGTIYPEDRAIVTEPGGRS